MSETSLPYLIRYTSVILIGCLHMFRHKYNWNIVACDVKQPISLTHSLTHSFTHSRTHSLTVWRK